MRITGIEVTVATIPLDTPGLRVSLVTPPGGAGAQATLDQFGRGLPYAAIAVPAAFFSMQNRRPVGNLVVDFHVLNQAPRRHLRTSLVFDAGNRASIVRGMGLQVGYQINDGQAFWEKPAYNLLHGLNTPLPAAGMSSLKGFNRYYTDRTVTLGQAHAALIEGERVTRRWSGGVADIPPYGFIIAGQGTAGAKIDRLQPGAWVHLEPTAIPPLPGRLRTAVGAGPTLVHDGQLRIDVAGEGFRDPAISGRTSRVVVGLESPSRLKLIVIHGAVDLATAGTVALKLGCREAMNLDGGTSAGMWAYGRVQSPPGRALTNILAFTVPSFPRPVTP